MGGNLASVDFETDNKEQIRKAWADAVHQSRREDGESYSGEIGMFGTEINFINMTPLANAGAAYEYLGNHTEKWATKAKGIPFYYGETDTKSAEERLKKVESHHLELCQKISAAFKAAKSKFVGCKKCGSKINREYAEYGIKCPCCHASLLPPTTRERLKKVEEKRDAIRKEISEAKPKNPKVGYAVGGWVSS